MDVVAIGRITAPVGIKGEMRVYSYADELTRFSDVESVLIDGKRFEVEGVRYQKGMVILKISGVSDRNAAEALRNKEVTLPREELWDMPEDTYLIDDLTGLAVVDEAGHPVGRLAEVISRSTQDLYRIEKESGGDFLLPAVKAFVLDIDMRSRVMKVRLIEGLTDL